MSFDLMFGSRSKRALKWRDVREFLADLPHMDGDVCTYFNEYTGVYCQFELEDPDNYDSNYIPQNFNGMVFHLNYGRPTFFAREALELVGQFCKNFDLLVYDCQASKDRLSKYDFELLYKSWLRNNRSAAKSLFTEQKPFRCPRQKVLNQWIFNKNIERIDRSIGRKEVFIQPLVFVQVHPDKRNVSTATCWADNGIPKGQPFYFAFPPCEVIYIARFYNPKTGKQRRKPFIFQMEYSQFVAKMKKYLRKVRTPVSNMLLLEGDRSELYEIFHGFEGETGTLENIPPEMIDDYSIA